MAQTDYTEELKQAARDFNLHCAVEAYNRQNPEEPRWAFESFAQEDHWADRDWVKITFLWLIGLFGASTLTFMGLMYYVDPIPEFTWWALAAAIVSGGIIYAALRSPERLVKRLYVESAAGDEEEDAPSGYDNEHPPARRPPLQD